MPYGYIYLTTDTRNGKIYIGQKAHPTFDKNYRGSGNIIKHIINKYKNWRDFLKIIILEWCDSQEALDIAEIKYISKYNSTNQDIGYNLIPGGAGTGSGKDNPISRAIYGYNQKYERLYEFESMSLASKEGFCISSIGNVCNGGGNRLSGNIFWIYKDKVNNISIDELHKLIDIAYLPLNGERNGNAKSVQGYNRDHKLVYNFKFTSECKKYGMDAWSIGQICQRKKYLCRDLVWLYTSEVNQMSNEELYTYIDNRYKEYYDWMHTDHLTSENRKKVNSLSAGRKHTEEAKHRMSEIHKRIAKHGSDNPMYGKHLSEETKAKMSRDRKGKGSKPIAKIDPATNKVVKIYSSIKEAYDLDHYDHGSIIRCCNGKKELYMKYKWQYTSKLG